jgi:hypothetical protein
VVAPIRPAKNPLDDSTVALTSVDNAAPAFLTPGVTDLNAQDSRTVAYSSIKKPLFLTGIRANGPGPHFVVITASIVLPSGETVAGLYQGTLQALPNAPPSKWHALQPEFAGETVTSSTFYGPNTPLFDPSLGVGNIRAVGSYKYNESPSGPKTDHGMIYQGPVSGVGGTWTQIDATPLVPSGTLLDTIAHSTMGDLVVGNYDTSLATGHAFIYDMSDSSWTNLNPTNSASVTAYGIWQNGGSNSTDYTIVGGFSDLNQGGVDEGYVVDYNSATKTLSHLQIYNFENKPVSSLISHFDGITATSTGYNLAGEYVDIDHGKVMGGFFASITRLPDGSFSAADWTSITFPSADLTTGNTVIGNKVFGIYSPGPNSDVSSYIATVSNQ